MHQRTCGLRPVEQEFSGRVAEKKAKTEKLAEMQKEKPQVKCETKKLANVFIFKYLGALFAADGSDEHDISRRVGMASARCDKLCHIFNSDMSLQLKLKIYVVTACSLLTCGSEG